MCPGAYSYRAPSERSPNPLGVVDITAISDISIGGMNAQASFNEAGADLTITGPMNVGTAYFGVTDTVHVLAPITATSNYVEIKAGDVDIEAPITVTGGPVSQIVFGSTNPAGVNIGDNLSNPSGFELSNTEFGFLSADRVIVLDLSQTAGIRVGDLTVDASKTPFLGIGDGSYYGAPTPQLLSIEGTVTGIGNPTLSIGAEATNDFRAVYTAAPGNVVVSGSIGTSTGPFGAVDIAAYSNIFIGSQAFVDEFRNDTLSNYFQPGLGGVSVGHEFITANTVALSAPGDILEQNTSPTGEGLHITGSLTIQGNSYAVELFGDLPDGGVASCTGPQRLRRQICL